MGLRTYYLSVIALLFVLGCNQIQMNEKKDEISLNTSTWEYFESKGPYLMWRIDANVFDPLDGFLIEKGTPELTESEVRDRFTSNQSGIVRIFGIGGDHLSRQIGAKTLPLKEKGIYNKVVTAYVLILTDNNAELIKFDTYIPEIDEYGFVDIKYVDDSWCYVFTNVFEYGENKPKCVEYLNKIKNKFQKNAKESIKSTIIEENKSAHKELKSIMKEENKPNGTVVNKSIYKESRWIGPIDTRQRGGDSIKGSFVFVNNNKGTYPLVLPPDCYNMIVMSGDLDFAQGPHYVKINNVIFVEDKITEKGQIFEQQKEVCSNDGAFTIQIGKPYSQEELKRFEIGNELGNTMINALYFKTKNENEWHIINFGVG